MPEVFAHESQCREKITPTSRCGIACAEHGERQRPRDREIRVVVTHRDILCGIVLPIDAITHIRGVRQYLESVEEPRRDEQVRELDVIEPEHLLTTERGRIATNVDKHVVHGSVSASHQFRFPAAGAAVHASHHPSYGSRLGILEKIARPHAGRPDLRVEEPCVERAGEQTPIVPERFGTEHSYVTQVGGVGTHQSIVAHRVPERCPNRLREVPT